MLFKYEPYERTTTRLTIQNFGDLKGVRDAIATGTDTMVLRALIDNNIQISSLEIRTVRVEKFDDKNREGRAVVR